MSSDNNTPTFKPEYPIFPVLAVLSGFIALFLAPLALPFEFNAWPLQSIAYLALLLMALSVILALRFLVSQSLNIAWSPIWPLGIFLVFTVAVILNSAPPPVDFVNTSGPLFVIQKWAALGRMDQIPWHLDSYAPSTFILLNAIVFKSLGLSGFWVHNILLLIVLAGTLALTVLRVTKSSELACFSFLFTYTIPLTQKFTGSYYIELYGLVFSALSLLYLISYLNNTRPWRSLMAMTLSLAALSVSGYRGLLLSFIYCLFAIISSWSIRIPLRRFIFSLFGTPALIILVAFPWLFRNFLWKGNPIYPIARDVIGTTGLDIHYRVFEITPLLDWVASSGLNFYQILMIPLDLILPMSAANFQYYGKLSPLFIFLIFSFSWKNKGWNFPAFGSALLYFICILLVHPPNLILLSLGLPQAIYLSCLGIGGVSTFFKRYNLLFINSLLAFHIVFSLYYVLESINQSRPFSYLADRNLSNYLRPVFPEFPLIDLVNNTAKPGEETYVVGLKSPLYYYTKPVQVDFSLNNSFLLREISKVDSAQDLLTTLIYKNIHFILVNQKELEESIREKQDPKEQRIWAEFKDAFTSVLDQRLDLVLWELHPNKLDQKQMFGD